MGSADHVALGRSRMRGLFQTWTAGSYDVACMSVSNKKGPQNQTPNGLMGKIEVCLRVCMSHRRLKRHVSAVSDALCERMHGTLWHPVETYGYFSELGSLLGSF